MDQGQKAYDESNYRTAIDLWEKGLKIAEESKDEQAIGAFLGSLGLAYESVGQHKKALECSLQALEIMRKVGDRKGEGAALNNIGVIHSSLGEHKKALDYHMQSLLFYKKVKNLQGIADAMANVGSLHDKTGNYEYALKYAEEALDIHKKLQNKKAEGADITNIGLIYEHLGNYEKAGENYNQALVINRELEDKEGEAITLNNIGMLFSKQGYYEKALSHFTEALIIDRKSGNLSGQGKELGNIGVVYNKLGYYKKAILYYEHALEIMRKIQDRNGEATALTELATLYAKSGRYDKAIEYNNKALTVHDETESLNGQSTNLVNVGVIYRRLNQYDESLKSYEDALKLIQKTGDQRDKALVFTNKAAVLKDMKQYDKAEELYQKSIKIASKINIPSLMWLTRRGLGHIEIARENFDSAIDQFKLSLNAIESMRADLSEKEHKVKYMCDKLIVYDDLIELMQNLHQKQPDQRYDCKSLEIFERKQGRIFLEEMGKAGARNFADIRDEVLEKENNLLGKLTALQSNLAKESSKPEKEWDMNHILELRQQIEEVKAEQQKLQETVKTEFPDYYALKYPKPTALKDIQKHVLESGEMMMVYGVMEKQTCLWVISKDQLESYSLQIEEKFLSEKVNHFRNDLNPLLKAIAMESKLSVSKIGQIAQKSGKELNQKANELYDLLVPKNARGIISQAEILYVIPTSSLYGLPFEALVTQINEKNVRYFVEDHPIGYLSSASLLKIIRESQARKKEKATLPLLAFANPVYGTKENPCIAMIHGAATDNSSFSEMRLRGYSDLMGGDFCELPLTEGEVEEIRTILGASARSLQLREKASRSNVFKLNEAAKPARLDDYRYVIFSCHGLLPGEVSHLTQPALLLSHPDPETGKEGFLTMADVFGIRLNADLVTLSACNTGRGDLQKGEGIIGLTRAFMYAGTPAVSVTLWSVESESAKTLSTGFYKNLKDGMNKAEALQQIKLSMIREEEGKLFKHPFFWAPMVIFGDGN